MGLFFCESGCFYQGLAWILCVWGCVFGGVGKGVSEIALNFHEIALNFSSEFIKKAGKHKEKHTFTILKNSIEF